MNVLERLAELAVRNEITQFIHDVMYGRMTPTEFGYTIKQKFGDSVIEICEEPETRNLRVTFSLFDQRMYCIVPIFNDRGYTTDASFDYTKREDVKLPVELFRIE